MSVNRVRINLAVNGIPRPSFFTLNLIRRWRKAGLFGQTA
ncbi:Uncharacterised protein [Vibrio cholerae]|nr:Uncharacterised protein [Vibrio cholerae]